MSKSSVTSIALPSILLLVCSRVKDMEFKQMSNAKLLDSLIMLSKAISEYCSNVNSEQPKDDIEWVGQLQCLISLTLIDYQHN